MHLKNALNSFLFGLVISLQDGFSFGYQRQVGKAQAITTIDHDGKAPKSQLPIMGT